MSALGKMGLDLAQEAGSQAVSQGMGMLQEAVMGNRMRKKQREQQQAYTDMQYEANSNMLALQQDANKKMFDYTYKSAGDKKKELEKAGLNTALMYGGAMGGGGGSASGGSGGSAGMGQEDEAGVQSAMMGRQSMGLQMELQRQQIRNLKAEEDKTGAEAENLRGTERDLKEATISSILEDVENKRVQRVGYNLDNDFKSVQNYIEENTKDLKIEHLMYLTRGAENDLAILMNDKEISDETKDDIIESARLTKENLATDVLVKLQGIELSEVQAKKMVADIAQGWERLDIEKKKNDISQLSVEVGEEANRLKELYPSVQNVAGSVLNEFVEWSWGIDKALSRRGAEIWENVRDLGRQARRK